MRITATIAAAVTVLGLASPATATREVAQGCVDAGTVAGFAQVGQPSTLTLGQTYATRFCRTHGFRVYRAYGNTPAEADRLREVAAWAEGVGFAAVACHRGDRGRLMVLAQTFGAGGVVHLNAREMDDWNGYARAWAARRGCEVYR